MGCNARKTNLTVLTRSHLCTVIAQDNEWLVPPLLSLGCLSLKMNPIPLPEALENIFPEVECNNFLFILTLPLTPAYCLAQVQDSVPLKDAARCISMFPFISIPSPSFYWFNKCVFYVWVSVHYKSILYKEPTRCNFGNIKFYSHQLMHFFIQLCISLLSYIKIT